MHTISTAIAIAIPLFTGQICLAQDRGTRPGIPNGWKAAMLTRDQENKIRAIRAKYAAEISKLQAQLCDLRNHEHNDLLNVLTDAQRQHLVKCRGTDILQPAKHFAPQSKQTTPTIIPEMTSEAPPNKKP